MTQRYFLAQDNDSHWYVVQANRRKEWDDWCEIDSDDERAWTAPEFATAVGGAPSMITFSEVAWP